MRTLRRLALGLAFSAAALSASAEWKWIGRSGDFIYYYDPQAKTRVADIVTYWQMLDYVDVAPDGTASMAIQRQIDCARLESKQLFKVRFNDEMGKGDRLGQERAAGDAAEFIPIVPGTLEMKIQPALCAK